MVFRSRGQHAIVFFDPPSDVWLAFGKDERGKALVGRGDSAEAAFAQLPDLGLMGWVKALEIEIAGLQEQCATWARQSTI